MPHSATSSPATPPEARAAGFAPTPVHEAAAAGTNGGSNRHLPSPRHGTRQPQGGDVHAGNEEDESHRGAERQQAGAYRRLPFVAEQGHIRAVMAIGVREVGPERRAHAVHVRAGLLERDARLQSLGFSVRVERTVGRRRRVTQ
jgi:hypothetical protein